MMMIRIFLCTVVLCSQVHICRSQDLSQTSLADMERKWNDAKTNYLDEFANSIKKIHEQLDEIEQRARERGDTEGIASAKELKRQFEHTLKVDSSLDNNEYTRIREHAIAQFEADNERVIRWLLINKFDSIAERFGAEFNQLNDPLSADAAALWQSALTTFEADKNAANSLAISQFENLESDARADADLDKLEEIKNARVSFFETGEAPSRIIDLKNYKSRVNSAEKSLERSKDEIVRILLGAKRDDDAKEIDAACHKAISGTSSSIVISPQQESHVKKALPMGSYWVQDGGKRTFKLTTDGLVIVGGDGSDRGDLRTKTLKVDFVNDTIASHTQNGTVLWNESAIVISWASGDVITLKRKP